MASSRREVQSEVALELHHADDQARPQTPASVAVAVPVSLQGAGTPIVLTLAPRRRRVVQRVDPDAISISTSRTDAAPTGTVGVDEDGDLLLPRRRRDRQHDRCRDTSVVSSEDDAWYTSGSLEPVFQVETRLVSASDATGSQLWRASLLLADFIYAQPVELVQACTVLELGAGVGFVALTAARFAREVFATDQDEHALTLCHLNVERNAAILVGNVHTRHFDWQHPCLLGAVDQIPVCAPRFHWETEDAERLSKLDIILASDVLYDDAVAEDFLHAIHVLMGRYIGVRVFVAAEKRVIFSAYTMTEIALGVDTFQAACCLCIPGNGCQCDPIHVKRFRATRWPLDRVPCFFRYERGDMLVLWELHLQP